MTVLFKRLSLYVFVIDEAFDAFVISSTLNLANLYIIKPYRLSKD